ncbi:Fic family protein [uncultured Duncaniella sp.]|nr:ATP-binding protein [uncultured Duncaniella sp.]
MEMTIDDIKALIAADESRTLELKKTTGELKDGMHSACAFLNTDGGWLIFGVAPKSLKILGQEVTDSTQQEIAQAITGLEPAVDMEIHYVDVPDRPGNKVIAMHFDGWVWGERPHTFHGCPYYKVESTTKVMPHDMYDERIRAHQPQMYAWESLIADSVTIADLNEKHIRGCIRLGVEGGRIPGSAMSAPIDDTLAKWNLLKNGNPTNGAVMLFSDRFNEYPQFRLRMARFLGTDKSEFIDNQRAEGNFFDLLDAGMAFFFKHLNLSGKITNHSLQREERLEVPYHALREALINSLCHRQWEKFKLTGSIAIYDDRIEIANPGVFPPQISPESIKEPHESYPYNLKIAEVLYKSTYLESWGSGAKRIMDACREQGIEEPTWRWDGGFVIVTFKRPNKGSISPEVSPKHGPSTTQARPKYDSSTTQVQQLIQFMGDDFMGLKEIMALFNLSSAKRFREYYLNPALENGAIERLYPDQPKHPKQKYRLTKAAKEWKNSQSSK